MSENQRNTTQGLIQVVVHFTSEDQAEAERLWAYPIGYGYAQICNIPFLATEIGLDDIVETKITTEGERDFVQIVKKNSETYYARFEVARDIKTTDFDIIWHEIKQHFHDRGLQVEKPLVGKFVGKKILEIVAIALPIRYDEKYLEEVISSLKACTLILI